MSLGQKTFAIIVLTVLGLTVALYATTRILIMQSFLRLEENETRIAVGRARNALDNDIANVAATDEDYAAWDRTYNFMRHTSATPIGREFEYDTLQGVNINAVLLLDTAGKIVFFRQVDFQRHQELVIAPREQLALSSDPWVRRAQFAPASGIVLLPEGPALISARPILNTQRQGPSLGVLVMARYLDETRIAYLRAVTRSSLAIVPYSGPSQSGQNPPSVFVRPVSREIISGSEVLTDVRGRPILEMRLEAPRPVFQQGLESLHYFLAALCIASLAFGAVSLFLLRHVVLARISLLNAEVSRIRDLKELSERVVVRGKDELGRLGAAINNMLQALQDSDLQFRSIAENIHQVFWVENADTGKIEYVSLAYESLWGRSRSTVYQNPLAWMEGVHPKDRGLVEEMRRQQKRGKIGATEYRVIRPDGSRRWILSRYFPVLDERGKLKQIAGLAEDITEFKRAEEVLLRSQNELEHLVQERTAELAQVNEALTEKQEHFRQLFATIPVPVWLCDETTHKFLEVNEAAIEHYGYSRNEFLQMSLKDIHPAEELVRFRQNVAKTGSMRGFVQGMKHRTKDGRVIDVDVSFLRVQFTGVPSILAANQDITERLRMEVELRHGQKLQAVGELAAGIAHEINTPIQFVGNNAEFLQGAIPSLIALLDLHEKVLEELRGHCSPATAEKIKAAREGADLPFLRKEIPSALEQTAEGVERVATIVQALKKFSHVDWGSEKAPEDLNEAIASTLIVARNELKYVAEVETVFGQLPLVPCHLGDLNQVFLNLLVNAAHSIADVVGQSGKRGRIRLETKTEGAWAVISIRDSGTGIPMAIRGRIFDPFFTTKPVGKGSGQGLALARAIVVEKHGGTLTFETEPGQGTTFYLRIPLLEPALAEKKGVPPE